MKPEMKVIWTVGQVINLFDWQTCGHVHPYTCCDHQTMIPTVYGLICPKCHRVQTNVHDFTINGPPPRNPLDVSPYVRFRRVHRREWREKEQKMIKYKGHKGDMEFHVTKVEGKHSKELDPLPSQRIYNHSPTGFAWGYNGSGPAQLALALLMDAFSTSYAVRHYQQFKSDCVSRMPDDWELTGEEIAGWAEGTTGPGHFANKWRGE